MFKMKFVLQEIDFSDIGYSSGGGGSTRKRKKKRKSDRSSGSDNSDYDPSTSGYDSINTSLMSNFVTFTSSD